MEHLLGTECSKQWYPSWSVHSQLLCHLGRRPHKMALLARQPMNLFKEELQILWVDKRSDPCERASVVFVSSSLTCSSFAAYHAPN